MTIIDAHRHVWDPTLLRYPWLDEEPLLGRRHLPSDAAHHLVTGSVFVQASATDGLAEARWVQALADGGAWPQLRGIVADAPVGEPAALAAALDELTMLPLFVGVRRLLQDEPDGVFAAPALVEGLSGLAERGIPFDACIRHRQLPLLVRLIGSIEGLRVVLDHLGKPPISAGIDSEAGRAWVAWIVAFASLPSTTAKLSGLAPEADPSRPLRRQAVPFLHAALDAFGPHRLMLGSDWPVSGQRDDLTYGGWFAFVLDALALDPAEAGRLSAGTAAREYGFDLERIAPA